MKTAKLIIGIISIVLFMVIIFQSCAANLVNAIDANTQDASGGAGTILAITMLISGIVGIATRNSKGGTITASVFYFIGALIGFANLGTYSDLVVWSVISAVFGLVFLISGIKMPKPIKRSNNQQ